jgi:hypothetical protein
VVAFYQRHREVFAGLLREEEHLPLGFLNKVLGKQADTCLVLLQGKAKSGSIGTKGGAKTNIVAESEFQSRAWIEHYFWLPSMEALIHLRVRALSMFSTAVFAALQPCHRFSSRGSTSWLLFWLR